jgi:hypothetical protein
MLTKSEDPDITNKQLVLPRVLQAIYGNSPDATIGTSPVWVSSPAVAICG